ncbi:3-deoxy-D-manno-octulosonic acid transferase [Thiomicrorhabdus aquaedulcis]|uniref:3-deoxy-D-manno-octulosonic acid transferase n=1 Tax=Thiomicrorhabdus aquaedulcis TaxID=2211106 RepID=UPI000FDB1E93|nr:glycosyltransferase N-terminal domain-containing protein [Thiomicrorhabdus aquaedulcis]
MYTLMTRILSPLLWLLVAVEAVKRRGGWTFFVQRLGLWFATLPPLPATINTSAPQRIWLHCASVGEVKAAQPLINALLNQSRQVVVTTNTPTGLALAKTLWQDRVFYAYLPLDWGFAVNHFLKRTQPQTLWVLETEIWPTLYKVCAQHGLPICIINGRLSQKTLAAPNWLKTAYRQALRQVNPLLARSPEDAQRFIELGALPQHVQVLGNLKYSQQHSLTHHARPITQPYVLLASSHHNEEQHIVQHWLTLQRPELMVIVPRHPRRSSAIQQQLKQLNVVYNVASLGQVPTAQTQVFLDDQFGKLMPLFEHAQLVIMGGSFVPKGGHNVLEPALYGRAILTGPDMSDFEAETALLKSHGGLIQCQDYQELMQQLNRLLSDHDAPALRENLGQGARTALNSQKNNLQRYLNALNIL